MADGRIGGRLHRAFAGLGSHLRSLFSRPPDEGEAPQPATESARQCTVCGTPVGPGAERCPLCRSSDIVTTDAAADPGTGTGRDHPSDGRATERRIAGTGSTESALADLTRLGGDPLISHDDKWGTRENAARRYRVDLPDDSVTFVDSKEDVRALLFRHYGTDEG